MLRILKIIITIFFSMVLMSQLLAVGMSFNSKAIENRKLKGWPVHSLSDVFHLDIGKKLAGYWRDREPLRPAYISLNNYLVYHLLSDSPSKKLTIGKNGWLFLRMTIDKWPCDKKANPKKVLPSFDKFIKVVKSMNKQALVVISPSKASIYPEFLPDKMLAKYRNCAVPRKHAYAKHMKNHPNYLELWSIFEKEKKRLLQQPANNWMASRLQYLYRPRDRHWSWETGQLQAQKIVEKISPGISFHPLPIFSLTNYMAEQSELAKRFLAFHLPEPKVPFQLINQSFKNLNVKIAFKNNKGLLLKECRSRNPNTDPRKVTVIHDSFMNHSTLFIANYFKESYFIHWNVLHKQTNRSLPFILKSDVIVLQTVEGRKQVRKRHLKRLLKELSKRK